MEPFIRAFMRASLLAVGAILWVYNLWRTFDAADVKQRTREQK